jgi:hypothetical protein
MIHETDDDRADRERMLDKLEQGFWTRAGRRVFGVNSDSDAVNRCLIPWPFDC